MNNGSQSQSIEEIIYEETKKRIDEMASPEYIFPEEADKCDAVKIVTAIVICAALILLCMTEVIR